MLDGVCCREGGGVLSCVVCCREDGGVLSSLVCCREGGGALPSVVCCREGGGFLSGKEGGVAWRMARCVGQVLRGGRRSMWRLPGWSVPSKAARVRLMMHPFFARSLSHRAPPRLAIAAEPRGAATAQLLRQGLRVAVSRALRADEPPRFIECLMVGENRHG